VNVNFNPTKGSPASQQAGNLQKLKKLSKEFESFFFKEVISAMRKTVPKNTLINGGHAEEIYKSMLDDNMAAQMADSGGSGIAQAMYDRLSKAYLNSVPADQPGNNK